MDKQQVLNRVSEIETQMQNVKAEIDGHQASLNNKVPQFNALQGAREELNNLISNWKDA